MSPQQLSSPSASPRLAGPAAIALLAIAAVVAACGSGAPASPSPNPSAKPSPSAPASPAPSEQPSGTPGTGVVELDVATDHDVTVVIDDRGGAIVKAATGRAGDGMSVRWGNYEVVNVDADTIRVTWVGLPRDEQIKLVVSEAGDGYALAFEQAAPPANSDATGHDRVLVLDFESPVNAEDVTVSFSQA